MKLGGIIVSPNVRNLASERIAAGRRTYFLDLNETENGKYLSIGESGRRRSDSLKGPRVVIAAEHLPAFFESLRAILRSSGLLPPRIQTFAYSQ